MNQTNELDPDKEIRVIPVGAFETNCVLIHNPGSDILYVVDPGFDGARILREIQKFKEIREYRVLLTHAHADHISAAGEVASALHLDHVYLNPDDKKMYYSKGNAIPPYYPPAENLPDTVWPPPDDPDVKYIATPGHSRGGASYYFPKLHTVLAGDSLFYMSIGRTDFPGGNADDLLKSVRERLFTLPDDTRVIAGHGPDTLIGYEKAHNPYFN